MESFGADVKLKDVFDEDSQYDIGKYSLSFLTIKICICNYNNCIFLRFAYYSSHRIIF